MNLRGRQHGFSERLDLQPGNQQLKNYTASLVFNGLEMDSIGMIKSLVPLQSWQKLPKILNITRHLQHMLIKLCGLRKLPKVSSLKQVLYHHQSDTFAISIIFKVLSTSKNGLQIVMQQM